MNASAATDLSAAEAARFAAANFALVAADNGCEDAAIRLSRQLGSASIFVKYCTWRGGKASVQRRRWIFHSLDAHHAKFSLNSGHTHESTCGILVRWLRGGAVPPLAFLENLRSGRLFRDQHDEVVERLRAAGWPEEVPCVRCGAMLRDRWDTALTSLKVWGPTCIPAKWASGECKEGGAA